MMRRARAVCAFARPWSQLVVRQRMSAPSRETQPFHDLATDVEAFGDVQFSDNSRMFLNQGTWTVPAGVTHEVLGTSQFWTQSGLPIGHFQILGTLRKSGTGTLDVDTLVLGGGATANSRIRSLAEERCAAAGITLRVPKPRLCTDNGVMIATLGAHVIAGGAQPSPLTVASDPGMSVQVSQL